MLSDPQSVTLGGAAKSLPAVSRGENSSMYRHRDIPNGVGLDLIVSHQFKATRYRNIIRLQRVGVEADQIVNGIPATMAATLTIDAPYAGFTQDEAKQLAETLTAYLSASSYAVIGKVVGGET